MSRIYRAVVHGVTNSEGTVDAPIGRNPHDRQRMAVVNQGRAAVSHYRLLQSFKDFCYISVALESGRTHQIRVHMRHIGHALVGDLQYGQKIPASVVLSDVERKAIGEFPRQALHARTLKLIHPRTGKLCEFSAPMPEDISALLHTLKSEDY